MARFYFNELGKDFECPECGTEIEVDTCDIDYNEDVKTFGRCPKCNAALEVSVEVKVKYKVLNTM
jgi:transcription elongation factor Elf1